MGGKHSTNGGGENSFDKNNYLKSEPDFRGYTIQAWLFRIWENIDGIGC